MAILASDIFSSVLSFLDDDSSGRYSESADLIPAINRAVGYLVAVFNTAFDAKKLTPESLRELTTTKVLAATGISTKKIDLSTITDLWTILGVDPDPLTGTLSSATTAIANASLTLNGTSSDNVITLTGTSGTANITAGGLTKLATFATNLTTTATNFVTAWRDAYTAVGVAVSSSAGTIIFVDSLLETRNKWAKRLTLEQWEGSLQDPFSAGSGISIISDLVRPGYIGPGIYFADTKPYILVRPASAFTADKAAIWYLKNPSKVTAGATSIEFPRSLFTLLVEKTLNFLSLQHGPESTLGKITDRDVSQLISLVIS